MKPEALRSNDRNSRQLWVANVTPLVTAAREGAAHAARTHSRERARVRATPPWWRRRWVMVTAAGLAAAGVAGGAYAVLASRRGTTNPAPPGSSGGGLGSTVGAGRDRVAGAARTVRDRLRGDNGSGRPAQGSLAGAGPDNSRNARDGGPTTGTGYGQPS